MEDDRGFSEPSLKRPRPVVSCLNCRRKKLKCDRRLPCEKCVKSGRPEDCAYAAGQEPLPNGDGELSDASKRQRRESGSSTNVTLERFNELEGRVRRLEALAEVQSTAKASTSEGTDEVAAVSNLPLQDAGRLGNPVETFSSTHSILDQFEAVRAFIDRLTKLDAIQEDIVDVAVHLYRLNDKLKPKISLSNSFHVHSNVADVLRHMEQLLPPPNTCTTLIQLYFEYFENCLRILHKGTTGTRFRAYLNGTLLPDRKHDCVPLLLAVVSIASSLGILSACNDTKLHGEIDGIGSYHLLRNYLALQTDAAWKDLTVLQVGLLTLRYHKSSPLNAVETWQWSGHILRHAMAAGLHQSQTNRRPLFEEDLRRKLWLTALEIELTTAIASGMPATCPRWQGPYPLNINDKQLWPGMPDLPSSLSTDEWTDSSCQHALAQSFNDRLAAYNTISSNPATCYRAMLEQTRHLEHKIQELPQLFRFASNTDTADAAHDTPSRLLAKIELDFLLRRPLNACYEPFAATMPADDRYQEMRIMWVQSTTIGICFQDLFDPKYPTIDLPQPEGLWDYFYNVYMWDVGKYFLANCKELQRLRHVQGDSPDVISPDFHRHTLRSSVKVMGWNIEGITKSLEDTINPMTRRLGRDGSDLKQVVKWTAIIGALRVSPTCSQLQSIRNELQSLVAFLKDRDLDSGTDRPSSANVNDSQNVSII